MRELDALVVGGGIAGLTAAYRLLRQGLSPLVVEERARCGGLVCPTTVGGVSVDLGAEGFAIRSAAVAGLADELGLAVAAPQGDPWIARGHRTYRVPAGVLGIPADLADPAVAAALSPAELVRAREDLAMGPGAGADAADLAALVRVRLGEGVLAALVEPVAGGIHATGTENLAVDAVAPGLRAALARAGSLTGAARALRAAAPPGPPLLQPVGGLYRLADALVERVAAGGRVRTGTRVEALARRGAGWSATLATAGGSERVDARRVVVAVPGPAAMALLGDLPELAAEVFPLPAGASLAAVTLAVDAPQLDAAPRGSGVLVAPGYAGAKALTHYSVKWPWVRAAQPLHVLRLSYGRPGEPAPRPDAARALADASRLLGVELTEGQLRGSTVAHWGPSLPPHSPAHRERVARLRAAAAALPGLAVTGAWAAGTGLAAVVPDAERAVAAIA